MINFKKILCFFGCHNWKSIEIESTEWLLPNNEELYEVTSVCKKCRKKSILSNLIVKL